ncbi:MAG: PQQ-dependent sugar dehydrogenase [Maribacter sp.]|nr:PQQ-dependent sugar dehydrogenase [Maribacter sp.]
MLSNCKESNQKPSPESQVEINDEAVLAETTILEPTPDMDNGGLFLPEGFGALVVADSVGPSRHLAVNDNGDIYVKLRTDKGDKGNIALRDTNNDGKADIIERFGDYPNDGTFATEMRIHKGYLYFSSELVVYRQKLTPGKLIPESVTETIVTDPYPIRWHNAKSIAFDNKGGLYVTFSAPTNACEDQKATRVNPNGIVLGENPCSQLDILGGIWKFNADKLGQSQLDGQRFATGIRSVVAMAWNDKDNKLYAINHGRDYLHNHAPQYYTQWQNAVLPAEQFMIVNEEDDYGWPYTYYDHYKNKRMLAPEYGGDGIKEAKGYADPLMGLPAHWAPNDMLFYKGDLFPPRYKEGAFVAFHGSTNRTPYPQAGYIVAFIPFKNGKPTGKWEVFADGFAGVETIVKMKDAKYRPMGLAEGPDGSLYISESKKGKIWRVLFKGDKANFGTPQLSEMEKRKSKSYIKEPHKTKDLLSNR